MGPGLRDLAKHNAWATAQVISFCQKLDVPALDATAPGTFGTIIETLRHIIDSEAGYLFRLTGAWPTHPWPDDYAVGLDVLAERAAVLAATLERFLDGDWDDDRLG
nr:DinB family protein [Chloroflexota bacterium]